MKFSGKNIWITGASSGIGKAVALEISKQKSHLILSARNKAALSEVAELCEKNGSTTQILPFDLSDEKSVVNAAQTIVAEKLKIDGFFQFGGISQRSLAIETPLELDRKIFEINFFGTINIAKLILPWMVENGGGHIAVTSSIVGKFGFPYRSAYSASKHALHGFFESLRAENSAKNIRVSIIVPGRIKTNISVNALNEKGKAHSKMDDGQEKGITPEVAAKRICRKLQKEQKEIFVGGVELTMVQIRRFFPNLYYFLSVKLKAM